MTVYFHAEGEEYRRISPRKVVPMEWPLQTVTEVERKTTFGVTPLTATIFSLTLHIRAAARGHDVPQRRGHMSFGARRRRCGPESKADSNGLTLRGTVVGDHLLVKGAAD